MAFFLRRKTLCLLENSNCRQEPICRHQPQAYHLIPPLSSFTCLSASNETFYASFSWVNCWLTRFWILPYSQRYGFTMSIFDNLFKLLKSLPLTGLWFCTPSFECHNLHWHNVDLNKLTLHYVPFVPLSGMDNNAHVLRREPHYTMKYITHWSIYATCAES